VHKGAAKAKLLQKQCNLQCRTPSFNVKWNAVPQSVLRRDAEHRPKLRRQRSPTWSRNDDL
jgi:hypothetical protein